MNFSLIYRSDIESPSSSSSCDEDEVAATIAVAVVPHAHEPIPTNQYGEAKICGSTPAPLSSKYKDRSPAGNDW